MPQNPCEPSPCGPNAECRVINGAPSCSCLSEFIGAPPNCRPECVSNSECPSQFACMNKKCRDPCPGSCGANAECRVVSHTPMCICPDHYTGDPFTQCTLKPRKDKNLYFLPFEFSLIVKEVFSRRTFDFYNRLLYLLPFDCSIISKISSCSRQSLPM